MMVPKTPSESFQHPELPKDKADPEAIVIPAEQVGDAGDVRMPPPDVREAPDAGAIHWHEQIEPL